MRTTLTLDDDVAALLARIEGKRNTTRKDLVNDALRKGLLQMEEPEKPREPFRTRVFDTGECYLPNLDCMGEVMEYLDELDRRDRR